jgi:hypothetical protein
MRFRFCVCALVAGIVVTGLALAASASYECRWLPDPASGAVCVSTDPNQPRIEAVLGVAQAPLGTAVYVRAFREANGDDFHENVMVKHDSILYASDPYSVAWLQPRVEVDRSQEGDQRFLFGGVDIATGVATEQAVVAVTAGVHTNRYENATTCQHDVGAFVILSVNGDVTVQSPGTTVPC